MSRWHELYCTAPDVKLTGGLPCCTYCFAIASIEGWQYTQEVEQVHIPTIIENPACNLTWPACVEYHHAYLPENNSKEDKVATASFAASEHMGNAPELRRTKAAVRKGHTTPGYSRLHHPDQIRVLQLSAGQPDDPVHADFTDLRLAHDRVEFDALSYTWADESGDSSRCRPIFIGPYWDVYLTTRNCENAIKSVRRAQWPRNIWLDAICINQDDDNERSAQVDLMSRIYADAERVLVYVGDPSTNGYIAMDRLARKDFMHIFSEFSASQPTPHHLDYCSCESCDQEKEAVRAFFNRQYFRRLWVVQEMVLAKSAWLYCGSRSIPWPLSGVEDLNRDPNFPSWIDYRDIRDDLTNEHLFPLLVRTSVCQCSDPRDKVFALLGLVHAWNGARIFPDYSRSVSEVYIGVAAYLIQKCRLGRGVLSYANGTRTRYHLPSWVPDWSKSEQRSSFDLHLWGLEKLPRRGFPIEFRVDHTSRVTINASNAALGVDVVNLGRVLDLFTWNSDQDSWETIPSPGRGRARLCLTCPEKSLLPLDRLVWLFGINVFAILRATNDPLQFQLICVCELFTVRTHLRSMDALRGEGAENLKLKIEDFTVAEIRAIINLDQELVSTINPGIENGQTFETLEVFSKSLNRVVDATICLTDGDYIRESLLLNQWLDMRPAITQILSDKHALNEFVRIARRLREGAQSHPGSPTYSYNDQPVGGLDDLNHVLWSLLAHSAAGDFTDGNGNLPLKQTPIEDFKKLKQYAELTTTLMESILKSTKRLDQSWGDLLPGAALHTDWQSKYKDFKIRLASAFGLTDEDAIPARVLTISILGMFMGLQDITTASTPLTFLTDIMLKHDDCFWDWSVLQEDVFQRQKLWNRLQSIALLRRWSNRTSTTTLERSWQESSNLARGYEDVNNGYPQYHIDEQMAIRIDMRYLKINVDGREQVSIV